jgi:hypothetical protein
MAEIEQVDKKAQELIKPSPSRTPDREPSEDRGEKKQIIDHQRFTIQRYQQMKRGLTQEMQARIQEVKKLRQQIQNREVFRSINASQMPANTDDMRAVLEQANKLQSKLRIHLSGAYDQNMAAEHEERYYFNPSIQFYEQPGSPSAMNSATMHNRSDHEVTNEDQPPSDADDARRQELLAKVQQLEQRLIERTSAALQQSQLIAEF